MISYGTRVEHHPGCDMQHVIKKTQNVSTIAAIRSRDATILERLSLVSEHNERKPIRAALLLSLTDELLENVVERENADRINQ